MKRSSLTIWGLVLCLLTPVQGALAAEFHVAVDGSDANPGTVEAPFATLAKARDAVREARVPAGKGAAVKVHGGVYPFADTLVLGEEDSGSPGAPVVYQVEGDAPVRITGGRTVTGFVAVTEPAVLERLPEESRGKVLQADLKAQGITDFGTMKMRGFPQPIVPAPLELFFDGDPMTLARWPNEGWALTGKIIDKGSIPRNEDDSNRPGVFTYREERPARWTQADDVWMFGYWCWDWADESIRVAAIDTESKQIRLAAPHHYGLKEGMRYYALNLLEEIDQPGEWYLERKTGMLYFWPPKPLDQGEVTVSLMETPLVSLDHASHVAFRGFTFECARGTAVRMLGGRNVQFSDCTFRNLGDLAIIMGEGADDEVVGLLGCSVFSRSYKDTMWNRKAGTGHRVERCTMYNLGEGGVILGGGERASLTPGGNAVVDCQIYNYSRSVTTNRPAIWIDGVGNRAAHNYIHHAPHTAIMYWGNDHLIEYNEINDVCVETGDVGAIYTGRDWTMRGTAVRYNYLHDINGPGHGGAQGIYLDDQASGTASYGNLMVNVARGFLIGGGHDNLTERNLLIRCPQPISLDARGMGWAGENQDVMKERLAAVPYTKPPWSTRYPKLAKILDSDPAVPRGNVYADNITQGCGEGHIHAEALKHGNVRDNHAMEDAPGFVDAAGGNYALRPDAPVFAKVPGFKPIPFAWIGPRARTHWEETIASFEMRDEKEPPPGNPILFVGSSSIVGWKLDRYFPELKAINRGFGGSTYPRRHPVRRSHYPPVSPAHRGPLRWR